MSSYINERQLWDEDFIDINFGPFSYHSYKRNKRKKRIANFIQKNFNWRKSGDETYDTHPMPINKSLHFGEYTTSRFGNRKITYSLKRKSQTSESEVTTSFDNHDQELIIDENSIRTLDTDKDQELILSPVSDDQELILSPISDDQELFDNQDEGTSCDSEIKPTRCFNELGNVSPDNFAEPNDYSDFIIENNDVIDLTSNDDLIDILSDDNENYNEVDSTVTNENDNEVDSTVTNDIVDKDILDFVENYPIDNIDAYDVNRLWKSEEMEKHFKKKILMSVQKFKKVKTKIITETSFVEDEIMGAHTAPNISIDEDLTELENEKNDNDKNNNQEELICAMHNLPVRPAPSIHEKFVNSTSNSEINQIFQKQIASSENDPKKKKEQDRIYKILMQNQLIDEETTNLMKNKNNQPHKKTEHRRPSKAEYASKQDENNPSKRLKPSETVTKLNITLPTNPKDIVRNRIGSPLQGIESKLNETQSRVSSNQNEIRTQSDKNIETKKKKKETEFIKSPIRVSRFDKKDKKVAKKQNDIHQISESGNKNVIKNQNETVDTRLPIEVHESKKNDQKVSDKKASYSESKNRKYESSKKNINKYSKKDLVSPPKKIKYTKLEKECIVRLERCDDGKKDLKRHISQENTNINKKRKNEHSDKNKDDKSKKHRERSHKSSSHHKSSHSSSKHKSSSSKIKITIEDKITNDSNEPKQLAELNNKPHYNDYKIQQSDSNQLKMKIGKIREESTSTSEQVHKPWDANLRTSKFSWINNNLNSIEERLALLERGIQTTDNVVITAVIEENNSMSSLPDVVSTTNGIEPCAVQNRTPSPEVSTSCVTPPAIFNEELPDLSTVNMVPPEETNITEHIETISNEGQNLNFQNILPTIEQEPTGIIESENEKILLNNPEVEQMPVVNTEIEKQCESTIEKILETKVNIKYEPEIPIIDLTIPEFIKKEEPLDDDIIEIQDVPMLRVKASVFLSEEANNIIEKIETYISFACDDVRRFNERIRKLTNRMDKTREEVLKTEHIETRALAIQPILANNLHYFNDTNMFKALTQKINESEKEKFTIDHVEHVFQLLVSQSPVLRREFLGCKKSNELSDNRPSSAGNHVSESNVQNSEQYSNIHNSIVSSSNIPYNASTNLTIQQPLHTNDSIPNQTYNNMLNSPTMAYSNTIRSNDGQDNNYLTNSSVRPPSNGYYNPQSAQITDSYQVPPTNIPLAVNSAKNNTRINSPTNVTSQIPNNLPPTYSNPNALQHLTQMVGNPIQKDNYYTINNTSNNYLVQQRIENTRNYNTDMYTSLNLPYANTQQQQRQNPQAQSQLQLQQPYQQLQRSQSQNPQLQHSELQTEQQKLLYQQQLNNQQIIQNLQRQAQVQFRSSQSNQQSLIPNQPQTGNQQQPGSQQQLQQSKLVYQTKLKSMSEKHQTQFQRRNEELQQLQKQNKSNPTVQNQQAFQQSTLTHQPQFIENQVQQSQMLQNQISKQSDSNEQPLQQSQPQISQFQQLQFQTQQKKQQKRQELQKDQNQQLFQQSALTHQPQFIENQVQQSQMLQNQKSKQTTSNEQQLQQSQSQNPQLQQSQLQTKRKYQRKQLSKEITTAIVERMDQQKQQPIHKEKETAVSRKSKSQTTNKIIPAPTSLISVGNSINSNNFENTNHFYLRQMLNKNMNGEENLPMPNSRVANNVQDVTSSVPNARTVIVNGTVYPSARRDSRTTNVPVQSIATAAPTSTYTYNYGQPVSNNNIRTTDANSNSLQANTTNKTWI